MKELVQSLIQALNINKNEFDIKDENLYNRFRYCGDLSLIFGESYMAGEWVSEDLTSFFNKILCYGDINKLLILAKSAPLQMVKMLFNIIIQDTATQLLDIQNNQSIKLSKRVADNHYDIPDILYQYMLDSQRQYTCGYWTSNINTLEDAQIAKINLLINKLQIPDNTEMDIIDIGCGWGGLTNAIYTKYPLCRVDGISISTEQIKFANNKYKNTNCYYCDYRNLVNEKKYDRVISVGIFEHIGMKNYSDFLKICNNILKNDGIMVLHTITSSTQSKYYLSQMNRYYGNLWVDKYIFPGAYIPTTQHILDLIDKEGFMYHHIQNLSISYAKTLEAWQHNFNSNWESIRLSNETFFTESFYRMWNFYLSSCIAGFNNKKLYLTQFVVTKKKYDKMYVFTDN